MLPALGVLPQLPDWVNFWLLAGLVSLIYIPVCFLTKPDDMDHLVEYFVQARPNGFWGPVKKEAIRRGLLEDAAEHPEHGLFNRNWTPAEADEWTRHDVIAATLSAFCYLFVAVGVAGTLLLKPWGFLCLLASMICGWLMFRIIDPKLKALSVAFETQQAGYLERVNQKTRWEETP